MEVELDFRYTIKISINIALFIFVILLLPRMVVECNYLLRRLLSREYHVSLLILYGTLLNLNLTYNTVILWKNILFIIRNMFADTFDTTVSLSGLYLWVLFSYMAAMMNCDLQRMMKRNTIFMHVVAIIAFFFLFTVLDSNNKAHVGMIWLKTIFVYILFLMTTKSKWYFTFPVLGILIVDQTIKAHLTYLERSKKSDDISIFTEIRSKLNVCIIVIIFLGFIHYAYRKYYQYNSTFSWGTLLLATKCKLWKQKNYLKITSY